MTDAEILREIEKRLHVLWTDARRETLRIADRLEAIDRVDEDPLGGIPGEK